MRSLNNFISIIVLILSIECKQADKNIEKIKIEYPECFSFFITNEISTKRNDVPISLSIEKIKENHPYFNEQAFVVLGNSHELTSQADDLNSDGRLDQITFTADFSANENKWIIICYADSGEKKRSYPNRTQAEISHKVGGKFIGKKYIGGEFKNVQFVRVPNEHNDHDTYFRYEGPGWESDKVGYRLYLDWRNAIDIFGKKIPDMVLHHVGLDGFDSYHEMADWGMDIFKVGQSIGIGSIGMWHNNKIYMVSQADSVTCEIVSNGPVKSQIQTKYFGWKVGSEKYNLISNLSITAGSRLTKHSVSCSNNLPNICTGLAKHEDCDVLHPVSRTDGEWQYLALYGQQSLAGDNLGIAILYKKSELIELTEDDLNYVAVFQPSKGTFSYYFVAAWEQEPNGIKNLKEFQKYLETTITWLNNPLNVKL